MLINTEQTWFADKHKTEIQFVDKRRMLMCIADKHGTANILQKYTDLNKVCFADKHRAELYFVDKQKTEICFF